MPLCGALITAGLIGVVPLADAAPFPPIFPLARLLPPVGGDGSRGFVLTGFGLNDFSGRSVSGAGDVNGDGIDDLVIGAQLTLGQQGQSYVVFGSTRDFPAVLRLEDLFPDGGGDGSAGFVLAGIDAGDSSGRSVSAAGDVNGDGVDDLIVGAAYADTGELEDVGESYVVFGSTQGFPAVFPLATLLPSGGGDGSHGFVLTGIDAHDNAGGAVSTAGDVNGDGIGDLIVAASNADGGALNAGETYVVFGSTRAFPAVFPLARLLPAGGGDGSHGFMLAGIDSTDHSGRAVSAAGDVNGDGIDDLVVGAPYANLDEQFAGETYVVFGSTAGFPAVLPLARLLPANGGDGSKGFVLAGIGTEDNSGNSVSAAGDVNGDTVGDLIIGAVGATPGDKDEAGESYVVFGSTQGFPAVLPLARLYPGRGGDGSAGFVLPGFDSFDHSGRAVSAAGDINGDGIDDVVVGADEVFPAGAAYVVFGSTQGFQAVLPLSRLYPVGGGDGSKGFVLDGIDNYDSCGAAVSAAGDVNGDGMDDLIIGAPKADPRGVSNAGETYIVFGHTSAQ